MTPLALDIASKICDLGASDERRRLCSLLDGAHFFDVGALSPIMDQMKVAFMQNDDLFQSMLKKSNTRYLRFPKIWLEGACPFVDVGARGAYILEAHTFKSDIKITHITEQSDWPSRIADLGIGYLQSDALDRYRIDREDKEYQGALRHYLIDAKILLSLINSPRVFDRTEHKSDRALVRRLNKRARDLKEAVFLGWTEITLPVAPRDDDHSVDANERRSGWHLPLHWRSGYQRYRDTPQEQDIECYLAGNAALGFLASSYKMAA